MKRKLFIVLPTVVVTFVLGTLTLSSETYEPVPSAKLASSSPPTIVATGSAKVKVTADVAVIQMYVRTNRTHKDNQEKTKKVVDALQALKLPDLRIAYAPIDAEGLYSSFVGGILGRGNARGPGPRDSDSVFPGAPASITPDIPPPVVEKDAKPTRPESAVKPAVAADSTPSEGGYNQTFLVLVTNDNPDRLREQVNRVLLTAMKSGASGQPEIVNFGSSNTSVMRSSVQFYRRDDGEPRRAAFKQAVEAAHANARAMAAGANVKIVETISISDEGDDNGPKVSLLPAPPFSPANPFEGVGESWLTVRVKVVCTYSGK